MILMRRVIWRTTKNKFLFVFLCIVYTLVTTRAMQMGHWIEEEVDSSCMESLIRYREAPELNIDVGKDKNALVVNDDISHGMVVMASGMFPFSSVPDRRIMELIDYVLPMGAIKAKNLNIILSNLSQIQACLSTASTDKVKRWAQSVLDIVAAVPDVLEGTNIDFDAESDLPKKLNSMVVDGKKKGLASYLRKIKTRLLGYYIEYVDCLKDYFSALIDFGLIEDANVDLARTAILKLDESRQIIASKDEIHFSDAVSAFQSVERFQDNAHKLVHSEGILLYCIVKGNIRLQNSGIRFFSKYDMCELCENVVWKYAHREESPTCFVVLSREIFQNSQGRDDPTETILLKKRI